MKLFIDTSNKKLILALIDDDNIIVNFSMKDSNNDMVKTTLPFIEKFLSKNNIKIEEIDTYLTTTGPGSYTGVKIAINTIRTIDLVHKVKELWTIDSFNLITLKKTKYSALRMGKNKFYLRNNLTKRIKLVNELDDKQKESLTMDYDNFTAEVLQEKIKTKSFKVLDNISKVKINYINKF